MTSYRPDPQRFPAKYYVVDGHPHTRFVVRGWEQRDGMPTGWVGIEMPNGGSRMTVLPEDLLPST